MDLKRRRVPSHERGAGADRGAGGVGDALAVLVERAATETHACTAHHKRQLTRQQDVATVGPKRTSSPPPRRQRPGGKDTHGRPLTNIPDDLLPSARISTDIYSGLHTSVGLPEVRFRPERGCFSR